jgi:uncharacterized protein YecT (DUF1311 family)
LFRPPWYDGACNLRDRSIGETLRTAFNPFLFQGALMKHVMCFFLGSLALVNANAASFDCAKARTSVEKMICADEGVSRLDDEMNNAYRHALSKKYSLEIVSEPQKEWLRDRNRCKNVQCLKDSYRQRISDLTESYKLVMSKDTKLCESMMALYNGDMREVGRIRYRDHETFKKIEWKADSKTPDLLYAIFDINNDDKRELVLRTTSGFHGIDTDSYYIFPENSDIFSKLKPGAGGMRAMFDTPDKFSGSNGYDLRDLHSPETASLSPYVVLNPFVHDGKTYISMIDVRPQWIVIAEYLEAGKLRDICYFFDKNIPGFEYSRDVMGE